MRLAGRVAAGLAVLTLAAVLWRVYAGALSRPYTTGVDILPLWLGAEALRRGESPYDQVLAASIFADESLKMRVGGFFNYYPPTAQLLFVPLRALDFGLRQLMPGLRVLLVAAEGLGVALAAAAAMPKGRGNWTFAVAVGLAALCLSTRVARIVIPTAQPGPLVVCCVGVALFALSRGRGTPAAVAMTLGAALKLAPVALLPGLLQRRRPRELALAVSIVLALSAAFVATGAPLDLRGWAESLWRFVDQPPLPSRVAREAPALLWLAEQRLVGPCTFAGVATVLALSRPPDARLATAVAALGFSAVAVVMAGSHHEHESLLVLPALAYVVTLAFAEPRSPLAVVVGLTTLASLGFGKAFSMGGPPDGLRWIGIAWVVFVGCALRVGALLRDAWRFPGATTRQ